jgi:nucleoside 2-deoxyribosyltransferase
MYNKRNPKKEDSMLIYLAGPIKANGVKSVEDNIKAAKFVALVLWKKGHAVICPHANTDFPMKLSMDTLDEKVWLEGDFQMIARCDAMVVMPNYEHSIGTIQEIAFAQNRSIPIYYYPDVPETHPTEKTSPEQCAAFIDTIMSMYRTHLDKNADYSTANILGTGQLGVVVRLWDKIARLMNLSGFKLKVEQAEYDKPKEPKNESVDDAYMDAAVYAVIGQLVRKGKWGK